MTTAAAPVFLLTFAALGLVLMMSSGLAYYRRTRDPKFWRRLHLSKDLLTSREYAANRAGMALVALALLGQVALIVDLLLRL
jgi:hypothetical protein